MPKPHVYKHSAKSLPRLARLHLITTIAFLFAPLLHVAAQTVLPDGSGERQYATRLTDPTSMAFAPDTCPTCGTPGHRPFVCETAGRIRVCRNGGLQPTPFVSMATAS